MKRLTVLFAALLLTTGLPAVAQAQGCPKGDSIVARACRAERAQSAAGRIDRAAARTGPAAIPSVTAGLPARTTPARGSAAGGWCRWKA
jgi:hypothetical protein